MSTLITPSITRCASLLLAAATCVGCGQHDTPKADDSNEGGKSSETNDSTKAGTNSTGGKASVGSGGKPAVGSGGNSPVGSGGNSPVVPSGDSSAASVARKLGRDANFLIGLGNDLPTDYIWENSSVFGLGAKLDFHYIYLAHGWKDWNAGGYFAQTIGKVDQAKGLASMSTVYGMAGKGENNLDVLVDDAYMSVYWEEAKLLMQRYAEIDQPAIVHLEPDFWAYAQHKSSDPAQLPAHLHADCKALPQDISGMARCWFKLARDNAPKVVIGLHASEWAAGSGNEVGKYLSDLGAAESDIVVIDILDRDAGCFEDGTLEQCKRGGTFYLDETNATSPNYAERLAFAKQVHDATGKPILWWQLPLGVPSETRGGTKGHFRDNKVHYLFSHVQDFVDAGGVGAGFGVGAGDQTDVHTDGGQFDKAVKAYYANPVALP